MRTHLNFIFYEDPMFRMNVGQGAYIGILPNLKFFSLGRSSHIGWVFHPLFWGVSISQSVFHYFVS